jgi:dTDP-4-amino-4,6-dideoxygalactose transaminase
VTSFLPFALPDIGEAEIAEVVDSLRSGWLTTGPKTKRFEEEFGAFLGAGLETVAVNSATAGLHLALEAIGIGPGDEVIVPAYTFTATAEVVRYLGADPVFVDVDPRTLNMDPSAVASAITTKTRAIMPVHFAGLACDMKAISAIAAGRNIRVIEDAAHAFPASCGGHSIGALDTDATVFSFYATKTLATGEGGMVVTRDKAIASRCRTMRLHGINRDVFDRYTSNRASWYYEVVAPGFKYNMTDIAAGIGIHQLGRAMALRAKREEMARIYDQGLAGLGLTLPVHAAPGEMHAWHLYVIRLPEGYDDRRDSFIQRMRELGIGCSVHFIPLHIQPFWRDTYNLQPEDCPNAFAQYRRAVSLPIYTRMSAVDQTRVVAAVRTAMSAL